MAMLQHVGKYIARNEERLNLNHLSLKTELLLEWCGVECEMAGK
jgi:hypothetical protein